jgi:hypothetical protein
MKNAHKSMMADWVVAVDCAAPEMCLAGSVLTGQRIAIRPFTKMDTTTRNGP